MANLFDYLKWRGDISVCHACFNEIDALILSEISYLDFSGLVSDDFEHPITLKRLADLFFTDTKRATKPLGLILPSSILDIFKAAAKTRRFANMTVLSFVSEINERERKQFSAMAFDTGDRHLFLAYRGTDDTIVGWKEDFSMSYSDTVAAQLDAKNFLDRAAMRFPSVPIRLGGHSKGGNLAMFSALHAEKEIRERACAIYCFDGPGFSRSITENENYLALRDRIFTFVPQNSIVGMLLSHDTNYVTVKSGAVGLYQHDAFNWKIDVDRFELLPESSKKNLRNDRVIKNWLSAYSQDERREFTEALFGLLESTGAKTLTDLSIDSIDKAREMISAISKFDKEKKKMLSDVFSLLIKESLLSRSKKQRVLKKEYK